MYIVNNCADDKNRGRVVVLKAFGQPNLRLFPGHNKIPNGLDLDSYFDSIVAKAHLEKNLTVIDHEGIPSDSKAQAIAAMEKNATLNREKAKVPVVVPKEVSENDLLKMATDMAMKMAGPMAKKMAKEIMAEAAEAAKVKIPEATEKVQLPKMTKTNKDK